MLMLPFARRPEGTLLLARKSAVTAARKDKANDAYERRGWLSVTSVLGVAVGPCNCNACWESYLNRIFTLLPQCVNVFAMKSTTCTVCSQILCRNSWITVCPAIWASSLPQKGWLRRRAHLDMGTEAVTG
jgi:hypothetical protein